MGYKFNPFTGNFDTTDSPNGVFDSVEVDGDITLDDGGTYATTLQLITPTANRTISFPDATGTVGLVAGSSGQLVYNNAGAYAGAPSTSVGATGNITLSLAGAASTPPVSLTGTWFSGGTSTTTKPQLLIEPVGTTSTAWSTSGTGLGVNAASAFTGNLLDLQLNGSSKLYVNKDGNIAVSAGSQSAPSLTFTGDPNTGIYSPGADQVAISTNGTGRLFVDASGNVGMGISSFTTHGATQHVTALGGSAASRLSFYNGSTLTGDIISANFASIGLQFNVPNAQPIQFYTNATERLRITPTGDLNFKGAGTAGSTQAVSFNGSAPVNSLVIDSSGRVGLGTSSPDVKATIVDSALTKSWSADANDILAIESNSTAALDIRSGSTAGGNIIFSDGDARQRGRIEYSHFSDEFRFGTAGTSSRLVIDSSGRVGVGTTTVNRQFVLHDNGLACLALQNSTTGNGASDGFQIQLSSSDAYVWNYESGPIILGTANDERARIDSSGRLLVGTSSTSANVRALFQATSANGAGGGNIYLARGESTPANDADLGNILFSDSGHSGSAIISAIRDGGTWTSGVSQPTRLAFSTCADGSSSPTERMRISSSGATTINTYNAGLFLNNINSGAGTSTLKYDTGAGEVTFDTSSRLVKENIRDCPYGIAEVQALKPRKYFRTDDKREEIGFVADELMAVLPEFVPTGPKSTITKEKTDTEIIPLGVNYEKLTAVLTKALQEAMERIETLEAKVAALESA